MEFGYMALIQARISYTSGQAAGICGLAVSTIKRWIGKGALKVFRTPGGDVRILHEHLFDFMREYNIPTHRIELSSEITLAVDFRNETLWDQLSVELHTRHPQISVVPASDDLSFGYLLGKFQPTMVIFEAVGKGLDMKRCRQIRSFLSPAPIRIAAVNPFQGDAFIKGADRPEVTVSSRNEDWAAALLGALIIDITDENCKNIKEAS